MELKELIKQFNSDSKSESKIAASEIKDIILAYFDKKYELINKYRFKNYYSELLFLPEGYELEEYSIIVDEITEDSITFIHKDRFSHDINTISIQELLDFNEKDLDNKLWEAKLKELKKDVDFSTNRLQSDQKRLEEFSRAGRVESKKEDLTF
jgi:hypothetical protein